MKKILILLLFIPFLSFSQYVNWDAVKIGSTDMNRIYVGNKKVWEKPSSTIALTFTTTSTSSSYSPTIYSSSTLSWEVSGVVSYTYTGENPSFNFSTTGLKTITVYGAATDINYIIVPSATTIDLEACTNVTTLNLRNNLLTELDITDLVKLQELDLFYLDVNFLDTSGNPDLVNIFVVGPMLNSSSGFNFSNNTKLEHVNFDQGEQLSVNTTLFQNTVCQLDQHGVTNGLFRYYSATITTQAQTCIDSLESKGWDVN
jgi:hypothetical protein